MNMLPSPAAITAVRASVGRAAATQPAIAMKIPSKITDRRTTAGRAPMACMMPNSRIRSRTLALMVEAKPDAADQAHGDGDRQGGS